MEDLSTSVKRAQQGESDAFEIIVRRFQDMAVGYSYALLGDLALAEDAAQEAFITAYYDLPMLREPAAFPGWFRRIVFKQVDRLRRDRQTQTLPLADAAELIAPGPGPAEAAEVREAQDRILQAIQLLPEQHRTIVTLFYISEHSLKEISAFLEIPLGTVKTRLHAARQQLKVRMVTVMSDHLSGLRPSRSDDFTNRVIQLFKATIEGDTSQVRRLLAEDTTLASASGFVGTALWQSRGSALHVAVMHGRKDIVDLLLAHGADINERDERWKFTALHHAIDLAFLEDYAALGMVDFLLARGAKKDLTACLWLDEYDQAKAMIERDPALANEIGPGNAPPLCYAHTIDMAQFLLDHGADMWLPIEGHLGTQTPLRWLLHGHPDLLRPLLDRAGIALDVFLYCALGDADQVAAALAADPALVHARTGAGHVLEADLTLLHIAAQYGQIEIARRLIAAGAEVNAIAPTMQDMTPLHLAICWGNREEPATTPPMEEFLSSPGILRLLPDLPRLLLEHGADVNARDSAQHLTPLGWSESHHDDETDRREVSALLREFGATG